MKNRYALAALLAFATLAANAQKQLTILHTNDTHSTILPLSVNLDDTLKAGRGGYLRRVNLIKEERAKEPNLLLFDSGDFSQGSPYYTIFKGDVEVGLMNLMGYDAATIGNHEFDFGLENMARLFRTAKFPIVCANYDFTGTCLEGLVKPYVVLKRQGVKVGVFGLSPVLEGLVSADNFAGVKYLDPIAKAKETVKILKEKEKCDVVVCLSHLGWQMLPPDIDDAQLIKATEGIDLVLGGHSHTYMQKDERVANAKGKLILDDQNGKHALFVGKLRLAIQNKK